REGKSEDMARWLTSTVWGAVALLGASLFDGPRGDAPRGVGVDEDLVTEASALLTTPGGVRAEGVATRASSLAGAQPTARLSQLPTRFEANVGQFDGPVRFLARRPGMTVFLTDHGPTLA